MSYYAESDSEDGYAGAALHRRHRAPAHKKSAADRMAYVRTHKKPMHHRRGGAMLGGAMLGGGLRDVAPRKMFTEDAIKKHYTTNTGSISKRINNAILSLEEEVNNLLKFKNEFVKPVKAKKPRAKKASNKSAAAERRAILKLLGVKSFNDPKSNYSSVRNYKSGITKK
jgi:hypothetical protein